MITSAVPSRWAWVVTRVVLTAVVLTAALTLGPVAPAGAAAAKGCYVVTQQNVRYCSATIDQVKQSRYPVGQRLVLKAVSVTSVSTTSITVSVGWPVFTPCPPGMFCGAGTSTWYQTDLVVPWTGGGRPTSPSVIDLYGTVTAGGVTPTVSPGSWTLRPGLCYVEWSMIGWC